MKPNEVAQASGQELDNVLRMIIRNSRSQPSPEKASAYVDEALGKVYLDERWSVSEVDSAFAHIIGEEQSRQRDEARSNIAWFVLLGFFLWTAFALVTQGFGQLALPRFWIYFGIGFLPVNLGAYCILALLEKVVLAIATRTRGSTVAAVGGCLLPFIDVGLSIAMNRALYLWINVQ